jgi:transcriptional regulator with XRE-family HTH domain
MNIGDRIKQFIEGKNLTIGEFAEKIDMSYPNLFAYVNGTREPGAVVLRRLFEAGADLNWILMGKRLNTKYELEKRILELEKQMDEIKSLMIKYDVKSLVHLEKRLVTLKLIQEILNENKY